MNMDSSETLALVSPTGPSKLSKSEGYWAIVQRFSILFLFTCEGSLWVVYIYKYMYVYKQMCSDLKQIYSELLVCWDFNSADARGQVFSKIFYT